MWSRPKIAKGLAVCPKIEINKIVDKIVFGIDEASGLLHLYITQWGMLNFISISPLAKSHIYPEELQRYL